MAKKKDDWDGLFTKVGGDYQQDPIPVDDGVNLPSDDFVGDNAYASGKFDPSAESDTALAYQMTREDSDGSKAPNASNYGISDQVIAALQASAPKYDYAPDMSEVDKWNGEMERLYEGIKSNPDFKFDINGDALFQQYKEQYGKNAQMAMMDTMGQASKLTGGYGSTYAQMAGQSAYSNEIANINNVIPQLEQRAYERYRNGISEQYSQLEMAQNQYSAASNAEYNRHKAYTDAYNAQVDQYNSSIETARKQSQQEFENELSQYKAETDRQKALLEHQASLDKLTYQQQKDKEDALIKAGYATYDSGGNLVEAIGNAPKTSIRENVSDKIRQYMSAVGSNVYGPVSTDENIVTQQIIYMMREEGFTEEQLQYAKELIHYYFTEE